MKCNIGSVNDKNINMVLVAAKQQGYYPHIITHEVTKQSSWFIDVVNDPPYWRAPDAAFKVRDGLYILPKVVRKSE